MMREVNVIEAEVEAEVEAANRIKEDREPKAVEVEILATPIIGRRPDDPRPASHPKPIHSR